MRLRKKLSDANRVSKPPNHFKLGTLLEIGEHSKAMKIIVDTKIPICNCGDGASVNWGLCGKLVNTLKPWKSWLIQRYQFVIVEMVRVSTKKLQESDMIYMDFHLQLWSSSSKSEFKLLIAFQICSGNCWLDLSISCFWTCLLSKFHFCQNCDISTSSCMLCCQPCDWRCNLDLVE